MEALTKEKTFYIKDRFAYLKHDSARNCEYLLSINVLGTVGELLKHRKSSNNYEFMSLFVVSALGPFKFRKYEVIPVRKKNEKPRLFKI